MPIQPAGNVGPSSPIPESLPVTGPSVSASEAPQQILAALLDPLQSWLREQPWGNEHGRRLGQSLLLLSDSNPVVVGLALSQLAQDLSYSVDIVGLGNRVFFQTPVTFEQVVSGVLAVADASSYIFVKRQAMIVAMLLDPDRATVKVLNVVQDASQPSALRVAALEALSANSIRTTTDLPVIAAMDDADETVRTVAIRLASRFMFVQEGVLDKIVEVALGGEGQSQQMALNRLTETLQGMRGNAGHWNAAVPKVLPKLEAVLTDPDCDMSENGRGGQALNLAILIPHPDTTALLERLHLQFFGNAAVGGNSPYLTALLYMEDLAVPAIVRLSVHNQLSPSDAQVALLNVLRVTSSEGVWRAVAALLRHDSEVVRDAAHFAIFNRIGDFRAITALLPYLDDPDTTVQSFAREMFNRTLYNSKKFQIEVNRLCHLLGSDVMIAGKTEAEHAARALRLWGLAALPYMQIVDESHDITDVARARLRPLIAETTQSGLAEAFATLRSGGTLSSWAASALMSPVLESLSAPQLVEVLVSGDSMAATQAAELLKQMGPHALSLLLVHEHHSSPEVQTRVRDVVGSMGAAAIRATGALEGEVDVRREREARGPWGMDTARVLEKLVRK